MTNPEPSLINRFKNFIKLAKKTQDLSEDIPVEVVNTYEKEKKLAQFKVDDLLSKAISARDIEKIELILQRNITINQKNFFDLCYELSYRNLNTPLIKNVVKKKYYGEMVFVIDDYFNSVIKDRSKMESYDFHGFSRGAVNAWQLFEKEKEFTDKSYALAFKDMADKLMQLLPREQRINRDDNYRGTLPRMLKYLSEKVTEDYDEHFTQLKEDARKKDLQNFLQDLDSHAIVFNSMDTIKEYIKLSIRENVNKINTLELPENAKNIISEISRISNELLPLKLDAKCQLDFDNIYKKRLPQVIEEYVSISPMYREKLKHHNENPDEILLDCLKEIKNKMSEIFNNVQNEQHNKQRVTRQYLKTM